MSVKKKPRKFGKYVLLEKLWEEGAYISVYRAQQRVFDLVLLHRDGAPRAVDPEGECGEEVQLEHDPEELPAAVCGASSLVRSL